MNNRDIGSIGAFVKPFLLDDIKNALVEAGFIGMTTQEAYGYGRVKGHHPDNHELKLLPPGYIPRTELEIAVSGEDAGKVMGIILLHGHTGNDGDGLAWYSRLIDAIDIKSGHREFMNPRALKEKLTPEPPYAMVEAVVKDWKFEDVWRALNEAGYRGMTIIPVRGFGHQMGHTELYRGSEYSVDFLPRFKLKMIVPYDQSDRVSDVIRGTARTGSTGDGLIWANLLPLVVQIKDSQFYRP